MRIALISDIHANLPALEAVLDRIDARPDLDAIYHLGDLVGYAPWPNEVVALLRERAISGVAGNYDSTTATGYDHCGCRYEDPEQEALSHLSYAWTRSNVAHETKRWLAGLGIGNSNTLMVRKPRLDGAPGRARRESGREWGRGWRGRSRWGRAATAGLAATGGDDEGIGRRDAWMGDGGRTGRVAGAADG